MSFNSSYQDSKVCTLPCANVPLIAPIWIDLNFEDFGLLYYRVSQNPSTLERVKAMLIDVNPALSSYQPTLAVIVTWFEGTLISETLVSFL